MFRNILVALDASPPARRAFAEGADLALASNARLTVISVVPPVPSASFRAPVDVESLRREVERETEQLMHEAIDELPGELPVTTLIKHGEPAKRILEQLQEGRHDLLVMGSRGRGRIATNLLGSVAADVYFHSRVPMLVIQPEDE